ncbi:DUF6678 family protein [Shewanella xiamenensis]|uniref:DUF6678 family protein n=1 Tax=Shewanella xiamenensis TaxID=332186 RepID=UPI000DB14396|nr:DUF6678 family protein [Shewanella xiamenensis]MCT8865586.1 hypothetical protein [Shewanella xiamenensis]MCT8874820.1 hypothetical protein [Shewanella xiamenensis]PZP34772.1 MAG: hypothetical protein DI594_07640 [Shewanella oneidensis]
MNADTLAYLNQYQLTSVMNLTKWRKLEQALHEAPEFVPHVRYKLLEDEGPTPGFTPVWWDELLAICERIEWLEIDPLKREHCGRLLPEKTTDFTDYIEAQLHKYRLPYSKEAQGIRIWGYLRPDATMPVFVIAAGGKTIKEA